MKLIALIVFCTMVCCACHNGQARQTATTPAIALLELTTSDGMQIQVNGLHASADSVSVVISGRTFRMYLDEYRRNHRGVSYWVFDSDDNYGLQIIDYHGFICAIVSTASADALVAYSNNRFLRCARLGDPDVLLVDDLGLTYQYSSRQGDVYLFSDRHDPDHELILVPIQDAVLVIQDMGYVAGVYGIGEAFYLDDDTTPRYPLQPIYILE